jgi:hypothetical protein
MKIILYLIYIYFTAVQTCNETKPNDLAKDLTARLNRCLQDSEPRSRSFEHPKEPENIEKGKQES